ncbi:response regulator [Nocardioides sp. cx-173]|uniref:response regulator n=1 Tax=Nocardioides sp. cx-173 TaxID=2898796 RepID=UPI001E5F8577|nr:response regulator [Nocardioides sp. cx-173]MCD4523425.1 response regulator transcription factor [Nocardioides sp. cx-173]UGB42236.1 response regulator transcription factor [Nocardioides sp. cx-173]
MTDSPIRVFLVDDQQMVRAGFRMLVESQPDLQVVGEAGDGGEAVERLAVTAADVVLMDVRMPRMDGVEATRRIAGAPGAPRVIVLTTFDLDEYAFAAIKAGASAFLLKDATPPDLLNAIRSVHAGDAVVAPSTTRRLLEHFAGSLPDPGAAAAPGPAALDALTEREREVLVLVGRGLSNTEIAGELVVAEATVKTHVSRLLAKTGRRDRVQLVVLAYDAALVIPGT